MTRLYGRSVPSERVVEYVPDVRFAKTTILSSIRLDGKIESVVFEGSLNGDIFKQYLSEFLIGTLNKGDIVVMDNLSSHKVSDVKELIESAGASILYLPPYSPDFNPIELMWSKMKAFVKKFKPREHKTLFKVVGDALNTISVKDITSWFIKDNYIPC